MGRLVYSMMTSLDGYVATPDGSLDWVLVDEELHTFVNAQSAEIGAALYGRRLYEEMTAYWPTAEDDATAPGYIHEFARIWKAMPRVVFSSALTEVRWNSRLATGDVTTELERLRAETDRDLEVGGATLAAECLRLGLVDEVRQFVHPVVLGGGTPFFPPLGRRIDLRLAGTYRFRSGVVYASYLVARSG